MSYRETLQAGISQLQQAGIAEAQIDAWYLLSFLCRIDRNFYYLHQEDEIPVETKTEYLALLTKRAERIPLQYITGEQEFMGLDFKVNSHVLIPRQDTEVLVEQAMKYLESGMEVLDMCTGSGCIAVSLAKLVPGLAVTASDVSKHAILQAKENAKKHDVEISFNIGNLFDNIAGKYDMIISNPPYIPTEEIHGLEPEVRDFEPMEALDGMEDGLFFYREIAEKAGEYLKPNGRLLLEIGCEQAKDVSELLAEQGFDRIEVVKDLAGLDRVVKAFYSGEP